MSLLRFAPLILVLGLLLPAHSQARVPSVFHLEDRMPDNADPSDLQTQRWLWHYWSFIPDDWPMDGISAQEREMGSGMHLDRAWLEHTPGDFRVRIAVLDSGAFWDQKQLLYKWYLNPGELPPPQVDPTMEVAHPGLPGDDVDCSTWPTDLAPGTYDVNGDGVFNIRDYRCDPRVDPTHGHPRAHHILDPSDLIHATHPDFLALRGQDSDGNGYVDDISGWDFFWDDNDAYDDTRFAHGEGMTRGAGAQADTGFGSPGACPDCAVIPLRVGDSFVSDVQNFAQAVVFAVDTGAHVILDALGTINNSIHAQAAIDYAYENNVAIIASSADETSLHQNMPAANERTYVVSAIVPDVMAWEWDLAEGKGPSTFLNFANCTNYGGNLHLSVPTTSCSSGATMHTAGVAGLLYSYALQLGEPLGLTTNEVYQLLNAGADDIHIPEAADDPRRFPSQEGWDRYFGYGRLNAAASLALMKEGRIPPEAEIATPHWFEVIDPSRTPQVSVTGFARARRAEEFTYTLTYAQGIEPLEDEFVHVIAEGSADDAVREFGEWDLTQVAFDPAGDYGDLTSANVREKPHQFAFTLRLRVTDDQGRMAEHRKTVYLREDPDLLPGFPLHLKSSGESSPRLADLNGDGRWEIILALGDGSVHAIDSRGKSLPGWPAYVRKRDAFDPAGGSRFVGNSAGYAGPVSAVRSSMTASAAVGKLDGSEPAVIVATLDGDIYAFDPRGEVLPGFPQSMDPLTGDDTNSLDIIDRGFFAAPVLADLNGDGGLEIIAGGMDGKVYVFDRHGARVPPFPVEARDVSVTAEDALTADPENTDCREALEQRAALGEGGGLRSRIIGTPSVGDLNGDGSLEIVVTTSEFYPSFCRSGSTGLQGSARLYAFRTDGTQLTGYPLVMEPHTSVLPFVGRGIPISPALADITGDGKLEIGVHLLGQGMLGAGAIYDWQGEPVITFKSEKGEHSNLGVGARRQSRIPLLINSGSFGDLNNDGVPDYFVGGASQEIFSSIANDGVRTDFDHVLLGIDGATGEPLPGFPQVIEDWQFFMNPSIADIDGDGYAEVLNGSGGFTLHAWNYKGERPAGWPKFTGQWIISAPAVGDITGDGYLDVVVNTRNGWLYAWRTRGPTQVDGKNSVQWAGFQHNNHNTGNYEDPLPLQPVPRESTGGCSCSVGAGTSMPPLLACMQAALLLGFLAVTRLFLRRRWR